MDASKARAPAEVKMDLPKLRGIAEALDTEGTIAAQTTFGKAVYSPQYSDENYVYRHIHVDSALMKKINAILARDGARSGQSRLLTYDQCIQVGLSMSPDWKHYLTHDRDKTLCFIRARRDKPTTSSSASSSR